MNFCSNCWYLIILSAQNWLQVNKLLPNSIPSLDTAAIENKDSSQKRTPRKTRRAAKNDPQRTLDEIFPGQKTALRGRSWFCRSFKRCVSLVQHLCAEILAWIAGRNSTACIDKKRFWRSRYLLPRYHRSAGCPDWNSHTVFRSGSFAVESVPRDLSRVAARPNNLYLRRISMAERVARSQQIICVFSFFILVSMFIRNIDVYIQRCCKKLVRNWTTDI